MFIVFGTRTTRRGLGFVAEYCAVCRSIHTMGIDEIRKVRHLYWVSLGSGVPVAYEAVCPECRYEFLVERSSYNAYQDYWGECTEGLIRETNPDLVYHFAERKAVENRVYNGTATREERIELFQDAMRSLERVGARLAKRSHAESVTTIIVFLFIISVIGSALCSSSQLSCPLTTTWYSSAVVLFFAMLYRIFVSSPRSATRVVQGLLVKSFLPLDPTLDELADAARLMRRSSCFRKLQAEKLHAAINRHYSEMTI